MNRSPDQPEFNPFAAPAVAAATNSTLSKTELTGYQTVRKGLQLIYFSAAAIVVLMILIAVVFGVIGMLSLGPNSGLGGSAEMTLGIVMILFSAGLMIAGITSLIGLCMCAACPIPNEKRPALTSVICIFAYFGISVVSVLMMSLSGGNANLAVINLAGSLLSTVAYVVGTIAFCLFLKRVGINISSSRLEKSSHSALIWFALLNVVSVAGLILIMGMTFFSFGSRAAPGAGFTTLFLAPYSLAVFVLALGTLFQFLAMLRSGINELNPRTHA